MNTIDICILAILTFFGVKGLIRGIILEVFTLVGLLIGYIVALREMSTFTGFVITYIHLHEVFLNAFGFLVIFLLVVFLFRWLAGLLKKFAKWTLITWVDRVGGVAFGVFKGGLVASLVILLVSLLPVPESVEHMQEQSTLFKPVRAVAPAVFNLFEKTFPETKDFYEEVREGFRDSQGEVIDKLRDSRFDSLKTDSLKLDSIHFPQSDLDQLRRELEKRVDTK
ncbi:CvpA family protein [bacterium]|nr:CvpA family protein [bacterium]